MRIGYVRVSTVEQPEERQVIALREVARVERVYMDKLSGKNTARPALQQMLAEAQPGDTIYISEFSRLARSTKDLIDLIQQLKERNVSVHSLKEQFDTTTPAGELAMTVFAAIATFERQIMLERQREGIAVAKRKGIYKGGHPKKRPRNWQNLRAQYERHAIPTITELARRCHCSRPTIYRWLKE